MRQLLRLVIKPGDVRRSMPQLEGISGASIFEVEEVRSDRRTFYIVLNPPVDPETIKKSLRCGPHDQLVAFEELGVTRMWRVVTQGVEDPVMQVRKALTGLGPRFLQVRQRSGLGAIFGTHKVEVEIDHGFKEMDLLFRLADSLRDKFKLIREVRN